jgi:metal-responsive CopG/Arc/MetJ family transcriptional regulator
MKRINVKVPDELHTRIKIAVAVEKTEISEVIREFLEKYVERVEKKLKSK